MPFEPVIGLEIHFRIKTKSKLFCRCENEQFNDEPNSHVCPVCMGFPGMLPRLNEEAFKKSVLASLALGCNIAPVSKMDRKSYFYPDLPKGYQISQYDIPIGSKGRITVILKDGTEKKIGITRLHLEDDAGKLTHDHEGSLVDYNRSGVPLMEVVSEPEIFSAEEAGAYARELQKIMRTIGASDADMEKGQMRFDLNISLRPAQQEKFGTKTEVKNLNSFRSLEKAIAFEIERQTQILSGGGNIDHETRGWDDEKSVTLSQRGKEEAADYRYFPEPDIPPLKMSDKEIAELRKLIPELPMERTRRFEKEYGIPLNHAKTLADDSNLAAYFENAVKASGEPKKTANWILSELLGLLKERNQSIEECPFRPENCGKLVKLIEVGDITGKIAKDIFKELVEKNLDPITYVQEKGLKSVVDTGAIEALCHEVLEKNTQAVQEFKSGKEKAFGALVGQVMAASKGSAKPQIVNETLKRLLAE